MPLLVLHYFRLSPRATIGWTVQIDKIPFICQPQPQHLSLWGRHACLHNAGLPCLPNGSTVASLSVMLCRGKDGSNKAVYHCIPECCEMLCGRPPLNCSKIGVEKGSESIHYRNIKSRIRESGKCPQQQCMIWSFGREIRRPKSVYVLAESSNTSWITHQRSWWTLFTNLWTCYFHCYFDICVAFHLE